MSFCKKCGHRATSHIGEREIKLFGFIPIKVVVEIPCVESHTTKEGRLEGMCGCCNFVECKTGAEDGKRQ